MPTQDVRRITTKPGEDLVFRTTPGDRVAEWHNPTRRQYLIVVQGKMEVSVAAGPTRQFHAGDVLITRSHVRFLEDDQVCQAGHANLQHREHLLVRLKQVPGGYG